MTDAPFFDPWPEPEPDPDDHQQDIDLPWMPPAHVMGVVVPLAADVHRGEDVVVRVTHVVAYQRGVELHVDTRVRPGGGRPAAATDPWGSEEPRVGIRLADGTRLGHRAPHDQPYPPTSGTESTTATLTQLQGSGGGLHSSSTWWVSPFPGGDALQVVVEWVHQQVPESSLVVELGALRDAAAQEEVLWDPPPRPAEGWFGWAGPAWTTGEASRWSLPPSPEEAAPDPEGR